MGSTSYQFELRCGHYKRANIEIKEVRKVEQGFMDLLAVVWGALSASIARSWHFYQPCAEPAFWLDKTHTITEISGDS